jgi:uncharacterized membrane protein YjdF
MKSLYIANAAYLLPAAWYFLKDANFEFVIYVAVIVAIIGGVFALQRYAAFPLWMLWALSFWGLLHVLGGAVETKDGVLFAYRIYPFLDLGSEFYVLKYDQVVHFFLYALVGVMSYYLLLKRTSASALFLATAAIMISVGISGMNEIMEFLIAISLERNGVGGYENAMLDLIFNFSGALLTTSSYAYLQKSH